MIGVMMAVFDSSFLCVSLAGAESLNHYLVIGRIFSCDSLYLLFLSLSCFSLFASSISILPLSFPISLYTHMDYVLLVFAKFFRIDYYSKICDEGTKLYFFYLYRSD